MKSLLIVFVLLGTIGMVGRLYFLGRSQYPRERLSVTALEDVIGLVVTVGFLIWELTILSNI